MMEGEGGEEPTKQNKSAERWRRGRRGDTQKKKRDEGSENRKGGEALGNGSHRRRKHKK
jgi:hypothetical protein